MALTKDQRAAFLASATQAEAARIVEQPGKSFRDVTRQRFGEYVSRGGTWNDALKAHRLAYIDAAGNADLRARIVASYKDGNALPPTE